MKRLVAGIAIALVAASLTTKTAQAQLSGNAVMPAMPGIGVTISGDFGRGLNDESGKTNYFGARATLGLPMLSAWAGGGSVDLGATSEITFGAGAGVSVIKGPLLPVNVSLQAGVGILSQDVLGTTFTTLNVPVGAMVKINVPSPMLDVSPWVMPRLHIQRVSNGTSNTEVGFGASGGISVTLPMGIGAHAALDWMTIGDPSVSPLMVTVGAHYKISVPSLGVM